MIDIWIAKDGNVPKAHAFLFLPSLGLTWFDDERSYGLTFAWLRWSLSIAWGRDTRP